MVVSFTNNMNPTRGSREMKPSKERGRGKARGKIINVGLILEVMNDRILGLAEFVSKEIHQHNNGAIKQ
jgi:hypothetical protein